ncbi:ESX secretion-associated protein EspG [Gordonia sp. NPDC003424]
MTSDTSIREVGRVGSYAVLVYCQGIGLDVPPYPFEASPTVWTPEDARQERADLLEWLQTDPPRHLTRWIQASMRPDLSMQLFGVFPQTDPDSASDKSIRINAVRQGDAGFVAVQEPSERRGRSGDIVIYQTDATALADVVVGFAPRLAAGKLGDVVIQPPAASAAQRSSSILERNADSDSTIAERYESTPTAFSAFVQVNPFRLKDWGYMDRHAHVHWAHKKGDGQYLIDRDGGGRVARPADRSSLVREVNKEVGRMLRIVREKRAVFSGDAYAGD